MFNFLIGLVLGAIMAYGLALTQFASKMRKINNTRTDLANRNDPSRVQLITETRIEINDCFDGYIYTGETVETSTRDLVNQAKELQECINDDFYIRISKSPVNKGQFNEIVPTAMTMVDLAILSNAYFQYSTSKTIPSDVRPELFYGISTELDRFINNRLNLLWGTKYESLAMDINKLYKESHLRYLSP